MASFAEGALGCHSELAEEAAQLNSQRWKWLPKCHMATHLAYDNARQANPRSVHCYADEDMVGRVKRMLKRAHGLTFSKVAPLRYIILAGVRWWDRLAQLRGLPEFL